ncbi:MAG: hypothetical protein ABI402_00670 [Ferruginibacter sp.]
MNYPIPARETLTIVNSNAQSIWLLDYTGKVIYVNAKSTNNVVI